MAQVESKHDSMSGICPHYEAATELLGRRRTGLILTSLIENPSRFFEIGVVIDGISDRMLSQRLAELEDLGLVERKVDAEKRPVLVEYVATQMARELSPVSAALQEWAEKWMPGRWSPECEARLGATALQLHGAHQARCCHRRTFRSEAGQNV